MPNLAELVSLAKTFGSRQSIGPVEAFQDVTVDEARRLAVQFLDSPPPKEDDIEDFLGQLATYIPGSLSDVHDRLVDCGIIYPGILYHGAHSEVRDRLISLTPRPDVNVNHLLTCLAWIGDEVVANHFAEWTADVPGWAKGLYVTPDIYALEAGWTLTEAGTRRDLYESRCLPLISSGGVEPSIPIHSPRTDKCDWCGLNLIDLLTLDLKQPAFDFLGITGNRLNIAFCVRCSAYASIFTDIDLDGGSRWRPDNEKPSFNGYDGDDWECDAHKWTVGPSRRSPYEANPLWTTRGGSQIGGFPAWVQDATFPKCPDCANYMPFVGQVAGDDIEDFWEGYTYAFFCRTCKTATTVYQQT